MNMWGWLKRIGGRSAQTGQSNTHTATSASNPDWSADREFSRLMWVGLGVFAVTVAGALMACWAKGSTAAFGIVIVVMTTGGAGGAAIGFLFGIPRLLAKGGTAIVADPPEGATTESDGARTQDRIESRLLASNSNLEEVSDWLTKIILGVGLTQAYQLNDALVRFEQLIALYAPADQRSLPLIATISLLFAVICGFLAMYLETRLVLSRIFNTVEQALANANRRATRAEGLVNDLTDAVAKVAADPNGRAGLAAAADSLKSVADTDGRPNVRSAAAVALALAGRAEEGVRLATDNTVAGQITAMQISLYGPQPEGYQETLRLSAILSRTAEATSRADYWFYQMAAFGQQHRYLIGQQRPRHEIQSARDNALDCAQRCLEIDASYRIRIFWLLHPDRSPNPDDDDLASLGDDPDFGELVGVA
ncbi:hypothetical protein [Sphingomonas crocodyli]|uniref:Uncharacterized protein n=1 Tax=Sphingomonas crocodyli TaxID=1979270 RepID=A0A437M710_9SPHN|nr:hypothetical protein [Sphingomonas crocodyli]RVT93452.1 hypothetical protein EOD43_06135 [Sphingomonas crocodyli]